MSSFSSFICYQHLIAAMEVKKISLKNLQAPMARIWNTKQDLRTFSYILSNCLYVSVSEQVRHPPGAWEETRAAGSRSENSSYFFL